MKCNWCHKKYDESHKDRVGSYCSNYCRMKKNGANKNMIVTPEIRAKRQEYNHNYYVNVLRDKRKIKS